MNKLSIKSSFIKSAIRFLAIFYFLLFNGSGGISVQAQVTGNPDDTVVNLSHSGYTTDPRMVIDSEGFIHVLWVDQFAGAYYTDNLNGKWNSPVHVVLPFETLNTKLLAGPDSLIYAYWIDSENVLYASSINSADMAASRTWHAPKLLAKSVAGFDVKIDSSGLMHLAYVSNSDLPEFPAGIYYQNSINGIVWSTPKPIFQSPYLRGLSSTQANVKIAASVNDQTTNVLVVWDNPLRRQILFSRSQDGGSSWETPLEISKPSPGDESAEPKNVDVVTNNNNALLIWQDGESGANCTQYFKNSNDGGSNWSEIKQMPGSLSECAIENQFLYSSNDQIVMASKMNERIFLSAFSGDSWSNPQPQDELVSIVDPETFNPVNYGCIQLAMTETAEKLISVGCDLNFTTNSQTYNPTVADSGEGGKGDIWLVQQSLNSILDWYPKPGAWSHTIAINNYDSEISRPTLLIDSVGQFHALWIQIEDSGEPATSGVSVTYKSLNYSKMSDGIWSEPVVVLRSSEGDIHQYSASITKEGNLVVLWNDGDQGNLYFSQVNINQANSASNWLSPVKLPMPYSTSYIPDIKYDQNGTMYLAYTIPLNEERGVYLIQSYDQGKTWDQPIKVFDGVAAGWEMVENPHMSVSAEGIVKILWTRSSNPFGTGPQSLTFSSTQDDGKTWSEPIELENKSFGWSDILTSADGKIFCFWTNELTGRSMIWFRYSSDNGITWSNASSISSFSKYLESIEVYKDFNDLLHIFLLDNTGAGVYSLKHYIWQNDSWKLGEGLEIDGTFTSKTLDLAVAISQSGEISTIFSGKEIGKANNSINKLLFTHSNVTENGLEVSPTSQTPSPPVNPTDQSQSSTLQTTPTPTVAIPTDSSVPPVTVDSPNSILPSTPWIGVILGAGLTVLLLVIVILLVVLKRKKY